MPIVTVSRQVGSFGDIIAAIVARNMHLELITRERIHELAQTCDPEYADLCTAYETEHGPGFLERIFFDRPSYTSLFQALTFEEAGRGNVVIIGRGAQIVLKDVPGVFKLRTVAPPPIRVGRLIERYSYSRQEAEEFLRKHDSERRRLVSSIFDTDPTDVSLFDMIVNTAHFAPSDAAEVVGSAVEKMEKVATDQEVQAKLTSMGLAKRVEVLIRRKMTSAVARNVEVAGEPGGKLTISGRIRSQKDKKQAEKIAAAYTGVVEVLNDLKVTELSFGF